MISKKEQQIKEDLEDFYRRFDRVSEYAARNGDKEYSKTWWHRHDQVCDKIMKGNAIVEDAKTKTSAQLHESMLSAINRCLQ